MIASEGRSVKISGPLHRDERLSVQLDLLSVTTAQLRRLLIRLPRRSAGSVSHVPSLCETQA